MLKNTLYLAVLPLIHVSHNPGIAFGLTEEILTLFPDRDFATQFFPDQVQYYIDIFEGQAKQFLTGGRVKGYRYSREETDDGRVVVRVMQDVG